jgi:hypothetical protein
MNIYLVAMMIKNVILVLERMVDISHLDQTLTIT